MTTMVQEHTSKATSINTVAAVYKKIKFMSRDVVLDYGGGAYDSNAEFIKQRDGATVLVYDPFNRTEQHNQRVIQYFTQNPAYFVVCTNVLNVIKEDNVLMQALINMHSLMAPNGVLYISVYERDKSGVGCKTTKGWQRNQKLVDYVPYVEQVFGKGNVYRRYGIIKAYKR